jgi:hypothetical protein
MKIGTKSLLYGAHCVLIHPGFVFAAWWKLYGFPWDPRLWVAFLVHDLGYWGCATMDGPDGIAHPLKGARMMYRWFGVEWADLCLYHSRYYARRVGTAPSKLCYADKFALALEPWWLYLPRVLATGEIHEYMELSAWIADKERAADEVERPLLRSRNVREWFAGVQLYAARWVMEHVDGRRDTWTTRR